MITCRRCKTTFPTNPHVPWIEHTICESCDRSMNPAPLKIYLVTEEYIPYWSKEVVRVFTTEDAANRWAGEKREENDDYRYRVERHTVQE